MCSWGRFLFHISFLKNKNLSKNVAKRILLRYNQDRKAIRKGNKNGRK